MKNNLKTPIAEKDKEGFELFDKENVYFFYYKDEYENILLQSKPFENEDDRAYAMEEVLQIFTNEKNIQIKNNSNLFYFVVKDSKDLPIARSTIFDTQNQVEKALVVFKQKMVAIAFPQSEPTKEIERFSAKSIIPIYETNIPNRFSFRVDVYRSEDDQTIFGKIEYSLTQERINFNGLDGEKITHFMRSKICIPTSTLSLDTYLDSNGTDTRIESHDKRSPINTLPKPATTNKIAFSHQVQKSNLEISLLKDNFILSNQCLVQNEQYHLEIAIENIREESCLLNIFVKSLSSNYRNTINEIQCKTDSFRAYANYRSDFMEGLIQEEWVECERYNLLESFLIVLQKLTEFFIHEQYYEIALKTASKMVYLDNCLENAYRFMMISYWKNGDRINALRQFERCKQALKRELGINVSKKTVELYEEIQKE